MNIAPKTPHIVVLGAGFGGLAFCQSLRHPSARITLIDRRNHHLFQPLLYQVASAGLSAPDIAQPIRTILAHQTGVTVLLNEVTDLQLDQRRVVLRDGAIDYDYLVLATGGATSYFGHPEWEKVAPGLKSLEDALAIRRSVLLNFERAELSTDPVEQARLLTIVVVGGGPTGVELAGAFAELARQGLRSEFRRFNPARTRVVLVEGGERVLANLPPALSDSAARQLQALGVEVRTQCRVQHIAEDGAELALSLTDGGVETIRAGNIIWAAGVAASPLTARLGTELDRAGRVKVNPDLSIPGHPEAFAIGDLAWVADRDGRPVPGIGPAAMQMGRHVARLIAQELKNSPGGARAPFRYRHKGTMATIGRSAAVARIGWLEFSGLPAWLAWLLIHLVFLIGFRNKAAVLLQWVCAYFTFERGARLILNPSGAGRTAPASPATAPARASHPARSSS